MPTCQSLKRAAWIHDRKADILDVEYFHVVFTVPHDVAALAAQNKPQVCNILFRATAETLRTIAADTDYRADPLQPPKTMTRRSTSCGNRRPTRARCCSRSS